MFVCSNIELGKPKQKTQFKFNARVTLPVARAVSQVEGDKRYISYINERIYRLSTQCV